MHCRCNLVFCYKCGGVLKKTAKAHGLSECTCSKQDQANLAAHEAPNVVNHNRPDQMGAAQARARQQAAQMMQAAMAHRGRGRGAGGGRGGGRGGGGGGGWMAPAGFMGVLMRQAMGQFGDDDDDDDDDDYDEYDDLDEYDEDDEF